MDSLFIVTDVMGDDTTVVNAARVSMGRRVDRLSADDVSLIHYLARHKHKSPFYHPHLSARVRLPIFIARQWMRHHVGMDYNEISGRYVDFGNRLAWHPAEWRYAAPNVKQGSSNEVLAPEVASVANDIYDNALIVALQAYNRLIAIGVCKEQARAVLPLATFTEFVVTGSLYAWFNFWLERSAPNAQAEIREYATMIDAAMIERFPHSWQALKEYR